MFVHCPECNAKLHFGFEIQTLSDLGEILDKVDVQLRKVGSSLMFLHEPNAMIEFQGKKL
jgi:hypothetical protein